MRHELQKSALLHCCMYIFLGPHDLQVSILVIVSEAFWKKSLTWMIVVLENHTFNLWFSNSSAKFEIVIVSKPGDVDV